MNHEVLSRLADGAVLINYDRDEVIDIDALDAALLSGKVSHVAVDADIFSDGNHGTLRGPLTPYLPLNKRYPGRLELLPHVAADTDHPTRVAGAKQAVDQIFDAIQFKVMRNLKGTLPEGYVDLGSTVPAGIGKSTSASLDALPLQISRNSGRRCVSSPNGSLRSSAGLMRHRISSGGGPGPQVSQRPGTGSAQPPPHPRRSRLFAPAVA